MLASTAIGEVEVIRLHLRYVMVLAAFAVVMPCPSGAFAEEYGTQLSGNDTTRYTFGWSAASKLSAPGAPVPIVLQYDSRLSQAEGGERCAAGSDGNDEPVRAFRFFNDRGDARVQIVQPNGYQNRRLLGTDLRDARKENSLSINDPGGLQSDERRSCPSAGNQNVPSPDSVFFGRHYEDSAGMRSTNPSDFDDHEWVSSPYYLPGDSSTPGDAPTPNNDGKGKVYALMHQEARVNFATAPPGQEHPYCTLGLDSCWMGAITFAESTHFDNCLKTTYFQAAALPDTNKTPNRVGACYMHNDQLTNPFVFPPSDLTKHIVAAIPYPYYKNWGCAADSEVPEGPCGRHGFEESVNIIRAEPGEGPADIAGKYFIFGKVSVPWFGASTVTGQQGPPANLAQKRGHCLLSTSGLDSPASWRGWNGRSFSVEMRSAYNLDGTDPDAHVCAPISSLPSNMQGWSITYNRYLKKYMLVGAWSNPADPQPRKKVHFFLSDDLRNWSAPQLLLDAPPRGPIHAETVCLDGITYPHVIDPDDPAKDWTSTDTTVNPNFDHPGPTPDIYFNYNDVERDQPGATPPCASVRNGSLGRLELDLRAQRQATLETGLVDPTWGFDRLSGTGEVLLRDGAGGQVGGFGYGERDLSSAGSQKFAQAYLYGDLLGKTPHGVVDVKWKNSDDVWYGSAYYLPANFKTANGNTDILRWDSSTGGDFGGVGLRTSDRRFHLVRGLAGTNGTDIGDRAFDLPSDRWFHLEVHQKLGQNAGESPYSEVFVDGELVASSTQPNMEPTRLSGAPVSKLGVGFVSFDPSYTSYSWMFMDRTSVLGGQRGAYKGSGPGQAPDTPNGLTAYPGQTYASVFTNSVPSPTGYRFYRRTGSGLWNLVYSGPSTGFQDLALACNTTYQYRATAYRQGAGSLVESAVSDPITAQTTACP
jgi:hypothetical protein